MNLKPFKQTKKVVMSQAATMVKLLSSQNAYQRTRRDMESALTIYEELMTVRSNFKTIKEHLKAHGANATNMAIFNANEELSSALRFTIPSIGNENAEEVAVAVEEKVEERIEVLTEEVPKAVADCSDQLKAINARLSDLIQVLVEAAEPLSTEFNVDAEFAKAKCECYAKAVAFDRIGDAEALLKAILEGSDEQIKELLDKLGFRASVDESTATAVVRAETPIESAEDAPPAAEVFENPVVQISESNPEEKVIITPEEEEHEEHEEAGNEEGELVVEEAQEEVQVQVTETEPTIEPEMPEEVVVGPADDPQTVTMDTAGWDGEHVIKFISKVTELLREIASPATFESLIGICKGVNTEDEAGMFDLRMRAFVTLCDVAQELHAQAVSFCAILIDYKVEAAVAPAEPTDFAEAESAGGEDTPETSPEVITEEPIVEEPVTE